MRNQTTTPTTAQHEDALPLFAFFDKKAGPEAAAPSVDAPLAPQAPPASIAVAAEKPSTAPKAGTPPRQPVAAPVAAPAPAAEPAPISAAAAALRQERARQLRSLLAACPIEVKVVVPVHIAGIDGDTMRQMRRAIIEEAGRAETDLRQQLPRARFNVVNASQPGGAIVQTEILDAGWAAIWKRVLPTDAGADNRDQVVATVSRSVEEVLGRISKSVVNRLEDAQTKAKDLHLGSDMSASPAPAVPDAEVEADHEAEVAPPGP